MVNEEREFERVGFGLRFDRVRLFVLADQVMFTLPRILFMSLLGFYTLRTRHYKANPLP